MFTHKTTPGHTRGSALEGDDTRMRYKAHHNWDSNGAWFHYARLQFHRLTETFWFSSPLLRRTVQSCHLSEDAWSWRRYVWFPADRGTPWRYAVLPHARVQKRIVCRGRWESPGGSHTEHIRFRMRIIFCSKEDNMEGDQSRYFFHISLCAWWQVISEY